MKTFKGFDLVIQLLLTGWYAGLACQSDLWFLIEGYLVVGAWHILSMVVHAAKGWCLVKPGARYAYHWVSAVAVLTLPIGSFWILVFMGAPMALFYTSLCTWEYAKLPGKQPIHPSRSLIYHENF